MILDINSVCVYNRPPTSKVFKIHILDFTEDIEVRFYEDTPDGVAWEGRGEFGLNDVHHQFAVVFKTPPYRRQDITQPVTVYMQLRRTSDGETSDPTPFQYTPENLGTY